jgi:hypothetical protein
VGGMQICWEQYICSPNSGIFTLNVTFADFSFVDSGVAMGRNIDLVRFSVANNYRHSRVSEATRLNTVHVVLAE